MNPAHERGSMDPWSMFILTPIILVIITLNFFRLNRSKRSRGRQVSFLIEREVVTSRCDGSKISGSQQTEVLQIWHKNDIYQKHVTPIGVICFCIYKVFPVHVCTQETKQQPIRFFHRLKMQMAVSIKIQKFCYHGNLTSHFSSLLRRAALLIIMQNTAEC